MSETPVREDRARVRIPPPLLLVVSTLGGLGLERLLSFGVTWPMSVRLMGGAFLAVAALFAGAAFRHFARTKQNPHPWTPTPALIVEGPYRYTRNPMYVALALIQTGLGLLISSVGVLALVPLLMVLVDRFAIRHEEAYLERRFGDAYRRYRASVRRWI